MYYPEYKTGTVTIDDGESLSDAFVSSGAHFVKVAAPAITSATLSFQVQLVKDGTFYNLYDGDGNEVTTGSAFTTTRAFLLPWLAGVYAFKVRSGTAASPVTQSGGDVFTVAVSY